MVRQGEKKTPMPGDPLPQRGDASPDREGGKIRYRLDCASLHFALDFSHDVIFITDGAGNILYANKAFSQSINVPLAELMRTDVSSLLRSGKYDYSTTLEAIKSRRVISEIVEDNKVKRLSTSVPIFDQTGNIKFVITNSRSKDVFDVFNAKIDLLNKKNEQYKNVHDYLIKYQEKNIVIRSRQTRQLFDLADTLSQTDTTIMMYGETGTGKEILAHYIHSHSPRSDEPFVPVNCAAIPTDLFEAEFFGYEAGAFTGANAKGRLGFFSMAHMGTLFLDEISELPLTLQAKLLRVLESGSFQKLGSSKLEKVEARILAASNQNLHSMMENNLFRMDLFYRLNVVPLYISPLRERPEDIIGLAEYFLDFLNLKYKKKRLFGAKAMDFLLNHNWPGNVRELKNAVENAFMTTTDDELTFSGNPLPAAKHGQMDSLSAVRPEIPSLKKAVAEFEKEYIAKALAASGGSLIKAAGLLGVHRSTLFKKKSS
ncbi:MAG: sigma 54-interacting transcriptional regulator [Deltaproteobacteria bacterium]|jgi:transcriptional regulator with PAS, ATPase and Fis domain|nr:sigma 54-interacting transcriptional regulator [Deltaproteobacteria bacterium]